MSILLCKKSTSKCYSRRGQFSSIAEFERSLINRRIYDGVKRAQEQGKYKGRIHSVDKKIRQDYVKMMNSGNYPVSYVAKMAKVSRQTLYNCQADFG